MCCAAPGCSSSTDARAVATSAPVDADGAVSRALCLAVDPDLLITVNAMTAGYVVSDDPDGGLKGQVVAIDYQSGGLDMTVFCTSITNKAHQTDDYRLATNAIYSKLLGTDFNVESGETPEPTPNPDTKPDTGKDTQSPETGDGMTVTVWVMAATLSVAAVLVLSAKKRADRSSSQIAT